MWNILCTAAQVDSEDSEAAELRGVGGIFRFLHPPETLRLEIVLGSLPMNEKGQDLQIEMQKIG